MASLPRDCQTDGRALLLQAEPDAVAEHGEWVAEQQDREWRAGVLEWVPHLSAHRALSFSRTTPAKREWGDRPLPTFPMDDPNWPARVAVDFHTRLAGDADASQPLRQLSILKQAIRAVTRRMAFERAPPAASEASVDDKLGWTMRFLRAAEQGHTTVVSRCLEAYPALRDLVPNPYALDLAARGHLDAIRRHACEVAREGALAQLRANHADICDSSAEEMQSRRNRAHQLLRRLSPGRSTTLPAVLHPDGRVVTDPAEMAEALRLHWQEAFKERPLSTPKLQEWLAEDIPRVPGGSTVPGLPAQDSDFWVVGQKHVEESIKVSPNSAPGPDGIPFVAWRKLGPLALRILHSAISDLGCSDSTSRLQTFYFPDSGEFNMGLLVLLPKKPTGVDPLLGEYFAPGDTRPLSIVNTDNRILANAVRLALEPTLSSWVSPGQRGFLTGRSILANVVEIDHSMMEVSLRQAHESAIFFDFRAAFPSIGHGSNSGF